MPRFFFSVLLLNEWVLQNGGISKISTIYFTTNSWQIYIFKMQHRLEFCGGSILDQMLAIALT